LEDTFELYWRLKKFLRLDFRDEKYTKAITNIFRVFSNVEFKQWFWNDKEIFIDMFKRYLSK